ncbi:MAG: penicillin acylase family protein [Alphaproteobacteria bacterium]|jgi:penicillin amidase|nr:penicillin acylase family protein [Alphaproteobacteria bacterium]
MKWIWRGLLLLIVLSVVGSGVFLVWLQTGLPPRAGSAAIAGLSAPVRIIRDDQGIPHIFADTEADAYTALGYVHAQDRLFQMDAQRMLGAGRSAEVIGDSVLRVDRFMRTLGVYRDAAASYESLPAPVRAAVDAYTAGVNAWLDSHDGALPIEYTLLRHEPEPWRPADSLVFARLMGLRLSFNWIEEMLRTRLAAALGPDAVADLYPDAADPDYSIDLAALTPALTRLAASVPEIGVPQGASNAWAVAGHHTAGGAPLLANDPHLRLGAPVIWYLARIETPELSLAGATLPGTPFHVLGHNGEIAWGLTTTGADTQDLFLERIDPDDPDRYLAPDGPQPFSVREETVAVRGGDPVTLTIRETRHGPVVSDVDEARFAALLSEEDIVVALASTTITPDDIIAEAFYRLNRARDWDSFRDAMRHWQAPVQNVFYADRSGTIGLITPGRIPIRAAGNGLLPVPGWTGSHDWTGFVPFEDLPQVRNPANGRVINANNPVVGPDYPHLLAAHAYEGPYRSRRIAELLEADGRQDIASSEAILLDTVSTAARQLLPLMLDAAEAGMAMDETGRLMPAITMLRGWDYAMDRDRPEPLLYAAWLRALNRALYRDEIDAGEAGLDFPPAVRVDAPEPQESLFEAYWGARPRTVHHMLTAARHWCDDAATAGTTEDCPAVAAAALAETLESLSERYGSEMTAWRWGQAHVAPLTNQVLSRVPVLSDLTDLGIATPGGDNTVNRGGTIGGNGPEPFRHIHGASLRAVYDLSDLAASRFMIVTGQSGNPVSPHYGNLVGPWRDGAMLTISGSEQELRDRGYAEFLLEPQ